MLILAYWFQLIRCVNLLVLLGKTTFGVALRFQLTFHLFKDTFAIWLVDTREFDKWIY